VAEFCRNYPYLVANIPLFVITVLVLARVRPGQFRSISIFSGVVCVFCTPFGLLYEGTYWRPERLGGWFVGIEDVMFCFVTGGLVTAFALWPDRKLLFVRLSYSMVLRRLALGGALGASLFLLVCLLALSPLMIVVIGSSAVVGLVVPRYPSLGVLSLRSMALFAPFYLLNVKIHFWLAPWFLQEWNLASKWNMLVLGIPLGEYVWACCFAASWPVFIGYVVNVRREPAPLVEESLRER